MEDFEKNCGILRMFPLLDSDEGCLTFGYDVNNEALTQLVERYELAGVAGRGTQFDQATNLMYWLRENVVYNGRTSAKPREFNSVSLLEHGFKKPENGLNCRMLATVLAEILLGFGMKSRIVSLHSITPYDSDNHVVTIVWIDECGKWILMDPSFSAHFETPDGDCLNPWELRNRFANQEAVVCKMREKFGSEKQGSEERLLTYMSKNLFYMNSPLINTYGSEAEDIADQKRVYLAPAGYNNRNRELINLIWRIGKFGDLTLENGSSYLETATKSILGDYVFTTSLTGFTAAPE